MCNQNEKVRYVGLLVTRNSSVVAISGDLIDRSIFGNPMADGDRIFGHPPSGNTQLTLAAGPGITCWKGVRIWSPSLGDLTQDARTQDQHTSTTISIPITLVEPSDVFIQFKKAKFLGVHMGMYWLSRADCLIGSNVTFTWLKD